MEKQAPFLIYDAAAGSGKTFTLVKEYIKTVLVSNNPSYYKHLLAITFTNKAVAEMKQRIVETLLEFSSENSIIKPQAMMVQIAGETGLSIAEIQTRSKKTLKHLLHNYAAFSVETIDKFNHRLIRTFARDLKLATNFEVTLDTPLLITEAVDLLINSAGEDKKITKVLLDFALDKIDDDKSWDISKEIVTASKLLYNENQALQVKGLKKKTLDDFLNFRTEIIQKKKKISAQLKSIASAVFQLISESGLEHSDFSGGYYPKYFLKLQEEDFSVNFGLKWQETLGDKPLYPTRVSAVVKGVMDELAPVFNEKFHETKNLVTKIWLLDAIIKNLTPLSVINLVNQQIEEIKFEKNILPISEFNALINNEIKNQPAPFIYERMGEKYQHFFIDEFQDTSLLQWENMIPLIDNSLSQSIDGSQGSLLLVGDAKQSIYRWRGGLPEQFMELYGEKNPFSIQEKNVFPLDTNYRSCQEIVKFNNDFFTFISNYFSDEIHSKLYTAGNQQKNNDKQNGYVKFEFIEKQTKAENQEVYANLVYEAILEAISNGFSESDICILTRKKKDGIALGAFLMEKEVPVISSETLLLKSSPLVQILTMSLIVSLYPNHEEVTINLLNLLHQQLSIEEEKHTFFSRFLKTSTDNFGNIINEFGINFDFKIMRSLSLYEGFEYCIEHFKLDKSADAYLFGFMDLVYEFEQKPMADKISFLDHWETKKDNASIAAGEGVNAVQLMTIHKSKGLEFPVVIFPFADVNLYDAKYDTLWHPLEGEEFSFSEAQINFKSEVANYGEIGEQMYHNHRSQLELDNFNLLYVTLTRAIESLYVFAEMPTEPKDGIPTSYNQLFMEFLKNENKWNPEQSSYEFGKLNSKISKIKEVASKVEPVYFSSSPDSHNLQVVKTDALILDSDLEAAIAAGNMLHDTMEKIYTVQDEERVLADLKQRAILSEEDWNELKNTVSAIIKHPKLEKYFQEDSLIYNERDIIPKEGPILRPDRININPDKSVTIIDYKTGNPDLKHALQVEGYGMALQEMGYSISEKMLIYCNKEGIKINKV